jgi:hypothetical protein
MIDPASRAMRDAAKEATVLFTSPGSDAFLKGLTRNADRIFCFTRCPEPARNSFRSLSEGAKEPDHPRGLHMIRWPLRASGQAPEPKRQANRTLLELETTNQIIGRHSMPGFGFEDRGPAPS